jgi:uncharacterized cupredoxin-like copper-binding protein
MSRIRLVLAAVVTAVVALACSTGALAGSASSTTAAATSVKVTMKEFKFVFSKKSVPHGKVTFTLVNAGKLPHDLSIGGKKSALIKPGKTGKLVVTLKKGNLAYKCTVPGHAAAGMKGTLKVT